MEAKDKIQVIVISVILSLAIAALYSWFRSPGSPGQGLRRDSADDSPIMVTGGSLYLGTDTGYQLYASGDNLQFADLNASPVLNRKITAVEASDTGGNLNTYPASGATRVVVDYKGPDETITLAFDPTTYAITMTNGKMGNGAISRVTRKVLPNLRVRKNGKIDKIHIYADGSTETQVDCGNDSDCGVVIHTELK